MDGVPEQDLVVPRGLERTIAYARDAAGNRPALTFLSTMVSAKDMARFIHLAACLARTGRIQDPRKFRKERGEIWAIKVGSVRVAAFRAGRVWYLTNGFLKQRDRWPSAELERAERIRWEHISARGRSPG